MSDPRPDPDAETDPAPETVLAEWRADPGVYWKNHAVLAVLFAVGAGGVLWLIGNPWPWTGPVAAIMAVFVRAAWLRSEAMATVWKLTPGRLLGPAGRIVPLSSVASIRPLLGDVLLVTRSGDKHLIKFLADPGAAISTIERARG